MVHKRSIQVARQATIRRAIVACALFAVTELAGAQDRQRTTDESQRPGLSRRESAGSVTVTDDTTALGEDASPASRLRARRDRVTSLRTREAAERDGGLRIVISLADRRLWALIGADTLLSAPVAVSTGSVFEYGGKSWRFATPRGIRTVLSKRENPVWVPPDWHYAEVARDHSLAIRSMKAGRTTLSDGSWLEVRDSVVGVVDATSREFAALPTAEEIVFDSTLFIPPVGTLNRRVERELGLHALDTGNGILLHGTPHKDTIGFAVTHGCIRLRDDDISWLHEMIPTGVRVYIY